MNITELVQSPRWKKFMGYVYGWGASVVLMGALFKIQHYTGAGVMLTVGMATEAIIFFFSAFEPPHEEPDWSLVYPELIGLEPRENGGKVKLEGLDELQTLLKKLTVQPETISDLGQGLNRLSHTAEKLADLSDASIATEKYVSNINSASESIEKLSSGCIESTQQLTQSSQQLQDSYSQTASLISDSGKSVAQQMSDSGDKLAKQFDQSGASFMESYTKLGESLNNNFNKISSSSNTYSQQLEDLNKNLSSLNSVYELQLNNTNEQIQRNQGVHKDLDKIMDNLSSSLENAQAYRKETEKLNKNLEALNTIYGNMLSAMDINKKRS